MIFVHVIILLFSIILLYHFCTNTPLIENIDNNIADTNVNTDTNIDTDGHNNSSNPLLIAFKNAANISTLQSKVATLNTMKDQIFKLKEKVKENSMMLSGINKQISKIAFSNFGGKPPPGTKYYIKSQD